MCLVTSKCQSLKVAVLPSCFAFLILSFLILHQIFIFPFVSEFVFLFPSPSLPFPAFLSAFFFLVLILIFQTHLPLNFKLSHLQSCLGYQNKTQSRKIKNFLINQKLDQKIFISCFNMNLLTVVSS